MFFELNGFYIGFALTPEMFSISVGIAYHHEDNDFQFVAQVGWIAFCIGYTFGEQSTWGN